MHHLVHGTTAAPSGAMMDEDYAHILATVGGPDEGNMVSQMQSMVCCEAHPALGSVYPTAPTYDGDPNHFADENQLYASMLQWDEFQAPAEAEDQGNQRAPHSIHDICEAQQGDVDKHEPTAPPWEDNQDEMQMQVETPMQLTQPIQCIITPPVHTTPTTVTVLAIVGSITIMVVIGLIVTLCWLAFQGVHITGFWLNLAPSKWDHTREDRALP
jgi:hypothetical protein